MFYSILYTNKYIYFDFFTLYYLEDNVSVNFSFYLDFYNYSYINLTLTIGLFAYCYAYGYMRHEIFLEKFLFLLLSFLYSMIFLLLANNFIVLLVG